MRTQLSSPIPFIFQSSLTLLVFLCIYYDAISVPFAHINIMLIVVTLALHMGQDNNGTASAHKTSDWAASSAPNYRK
jgi:hypothetical protein